MRFTLIALFIFIQIGCGSMHSSKPTFNQKMLKDQEERVKRGEDPNGEAVNGPSADPLQASLWAKSVGSPYIIRNQKAQKVGDLLTIMIDESANASTGAKTDAKRDNKIDMGGDLSMGLSASDPKGSFSFGTNNKNEFKGEGKTDRSGRFETTVQAAVENVLANGTLFIRGHKVMTINNEDQQVEISGFVRPDDIRINNTVISSKLADAEIRYVGNGVVSDKQNTGWGTRLLDAIWPF